MSTVELGHAAEDIAANYLVAAGFTILSRNWRNRWCEIDIIAQSNSSLRFVEVKYRSNISYGYAAEYISRDKARRLIRAALAWCQACRYDGAYQVDVICVEGSLSNATISHIENALTT